MEDRDFLHGMESTYRKSRFFIIRKIISDGSVTVPDVADATGLSTTTISKFIARMKSEKLLKDNKIEKDGKRGRRALSYNISNDSFYFIGVDVKAYELGLGLMGFAGEMVKMEVDKNYVFENTRDNLDYICGKVKEFAGSSGMNIAGVNFNLSGRVDSHRGTSYSVFNFEESRDISLAEYLGEVLGLPVTIENDTKSMAFGDYLAYNRPWGNVLYVNVGWGLGLGIIIDGKLYYGADGYSGELGHVHAYENNILCHCGQKGCLETEVSMKAVLRKLQERLHSGESSFLTGKYRRGEKISPDDIISAADRGDQLCTELISTAANELGKQMSGMLNLFNPDCIILGGKLATATSYYFQQHVTAAIRQYSLKLMSHNVQIVNSKLGDKAGIIGACMIARNFYLEKI